MSEFKDAVNFEHRGAAIRAMLRHYGCDAQANIRESILVRGGMFCGRKFSADGYLVIWFIEEDQIKYYSPTGDLIACLDSQACISEAEKLGQPTHTTESVSFPAVEVPQPQRRAA